MGQGPGLNKARYISRVLDCYAASLKKGGNQQELETSKSTQILQLHSGSYVHRTAYQLE